jgi:hypothetical protein
MDIDQDKIAGWLAEANRQYVDAANKAKQYEELRLISFGEVQILQQQLEMLKQEKNKEELNDEETKEDSK